MPQPLSRFGPNISIYLNNSDDLPAENRPQLAIYAAKVIAAWASLESFMTRIFVKMLGAHAKPGAAIYGELASNAAQKAALRAVAKQALAPHELEVFEAVLQLYSTAAKTRNKIAHWPWGVCPEIPDGLLLVDPQMLLDNAASLELYDLERAKRDRHTPEPDYPDLDLERILVFKERDFLDAASRINRVIGYAAVFNLVLNRSHPSNRDDEEFRLLSEKPEIQTILKRRLNRQKNTGETAARD